MEVEKINLMLRSILLLEEIKEIYEAKLDCDYMESCAIEKIHRDILNGRKPDWTAVDNVYRLTDELTHRLDRLTSDGDNLLKEVFAIVQED